MKRLFYFLIAMTVAPAWSGSDELLPPREAYVYSVEANGNAVVLNWEVKPGYYLYKDKFSFHSQSSGITLGDPRMPKGKLKVDEFFGEMEIYRGSFEILIPIVRSPGSPDVLDFEIRSQGCADIGICFPPQRWPDSVALPLAPATAAVSAPAPFDSPGGSRFNWSGDEILPPEEVFVLSAEMVAPGLLRARWDIAPGHYMYKDKFRFSSSTPGVDLGQPQFPQGNFKEDEYFGRSEVFFRYVEILIPVGTTGSEPEEFLLVVESQGCKEDGICYTPFTQEAPVLLQSIAGTAAPARPAAAAAPAKVSEQARLAGLIRDSHLSWVLLTFFGLGLLLAFTPCVLPMVPILSGIIAGQGENVSTRRAFMLSLTYVLGMAITYTAAGAVAALFGQQFQAIFQQTWIIVGFAALFVVLALSMFGFYELQMPASIQTRVSGVSNRQQAGTYAGTAIMGVLSALIVTACVAPPLVATLAVIGEAGRPARGAMALFSLSMGMGAPLLLVGASAGKLLPRAGPWMNAVKAAFGVMLLAVAVWMLERVLPHPVTMFLWALLVLGTGVFLVTRAVPTLASPGWSFFWRALGLGIAAYGLLILAGALAGGHDTWRPLRGTALIGQSPALHEGLEFRRIKTVAELDAAIAEATASGRPVMLDFYADWCVSCLEMEKYTFTDDRVKKALATSVLLQADVTANDEADKALLRRFRIYGPPTIAFWDKAGNELEGYRVVGFMPADEFAAHVSEALGTPAE